MSNGTGVSDMVQSWLSGNGSSSGEGSQASSGEHISQASPDSDEVVRAENSEVDDLLPGSGEDTPTDSSEKGSAKPEANQKTSGEKEVITVTDENGRRRKIEVDYSNREAVKKAHLMAAGARKWQAERDQEKQAHSTTRQELEQRNKDWSVLEQAYKQGPDQLFDLLAGRRGAFQEHVNKHIQRAEYLKNASPQEIQALEARERAEQREREIQQIRKDNEEIRKQLNETKDHADLRALESNVNPVFDKYRFADKLGNADDEHMFDEMLWNSALKRLEPYEEKGLLSQEIIDREFRSVASAIRKRISVQAEQKAGRVMQQKKQEATENVQAKVKSGYNQDGGTAQEARNLLNQGAGGLNQMFKQWGKFGSVFNGKK